MGPQGPIIPPGQEKKLKCSCGCGLFKRNVWEEIAIDSFAPKRGWFGLPTFTWNCKDCGKVFEPAKEATREPD